MATPNYGYEKRQKELAKKRKKEDKLKAKADRKVGGPGDGDAAPTKPALATRPRPFRRSADTVHSSPRIRFASSAIEAGDRSAGAIVLASA